MNSARLEAHSALQMFAMEGAQVGRVSGLVGVLGIIALMPLQMAIPEIFGLPFLLIKESSRSFNCMQVGDALRVAFI